MYGEICSLFATIEGSTRIKQPAEEKADIPCLGLPNLFSHSGLLSKEGTAWFMKFFIKAACIWFCVQYAAPNSIGRVDIQPAALLLSVHSHPCPRKCWFSARQYPHTSHIGGPFAGLFADRCPRAAAQNPDTQTVAAFAGIDGHAYV